MENVDFNNRCITILDTKNKKPLVLPVGEFIMANLRKRFDEKINEFVFPSIKFRGHLKDPRKAKDRIIKATGIKFTLHDLRRTFTTCANNLNISRYAIKQLLNHKSGGDVTEGYIVFDVESLRESMQRIESKMLELLNHV